jgi:hypothetical protein
MTATKSAGANAPLDEVPLVEISHDATYDPGGEGATAALMPIPDNPQAVLEAAPDRATFVMIALDRARQWLVSAGSIEEVNELRARAEAVRVYTRQAELGREAENAAAEIRLRAERRVGELLKEMPRNVGGRPREAGRKTRRDDRQVSLGELGVSRDESSTFQRLAAIPEDDFESRLASAKGSGRVSRAAMLRDEDAQEQQRARAEFDAFVASITPPDYDPTFDNEAVEDAGHLDGACADILELAARRPAEEFAARYYGRRTIPGVLPKIEAAVAYVTAVHRHLEERIG